MRAVMQQVPEAWLEERSRLGHDRFDELWEGVLHMVPPPGFLHQRMGTQVVMFLGPLLNRRGIGTSYETGVFRPGSNRKDYRTPDIVFVALDSPAIREHGIEGAPLAVVEIRSPDDETYDKLPFYAALGVREVIVLTPDARAVEIYRLAGAAYVAVSADERGRVHAETIDARFSTAPGPRLRLDCAGESVEI
jgi:Uma2 family endonuclease